MENTQSDGVCCPHLRHYLRESHSLCFRMRINMCSVVSMRVMYVYVHMRKTARTEYEGVFGWHLKIVPTHDQQRVDGIEATKFECVT